MRLLGLLIIASLGACSEEPAPQELPPPTTYYITRDDLWRDVPRDICRSKNATFLSELIGQVRGQLPPSIQGSFEFEDFNVQKGADESMAVLRFWVDKPGSGRVMMISQAPFASQGCKVGSLEIAEGVNTMVFD